MLNKVTFDKFRDIAEQVNNIDNIPQLKKTKVKTSDIGQFSFYNAAKGYVNFDYNKLSQYSNIHVLHSYYMRHEVLINPLVDVIYIGQQDYDSIQSGSIVKLWVLQVGQDPLARLDLDLYVFNHNHFTTFYSQIKNIEYTAVEFESSSYGQIDFRQAIPVNGVATVTNSYHSFVYKFTNIDHTVMDYVELPYIFYHDGNDFIIDGDNIYGGVDCDYDVIPFEERLKQIQQNGIDPITLQLITKEDGHHLQLMAGRWGNCLDWVFIHLLKIRKIPVCIICGNVQYNTHQFEWKPIPNNVINAVTLPEIEIDR